MAMRIANPKAGDLDYDGSCAPNAPCAFSHITFSVGIFQWMPKADGKGIKRGKVIKRIKGYSSEPAIVFKMAEQWINQHMIIKEGVKALGEEIAEANADIAGVTGLQQETDLEYTRDKVLERADINPKPNIVIDVYLNGDWKCRCGKCDKIFTFNPKTGRVIVCEFCRNWSIVG